MLWPHFSTAPLKTFTRVNWAICGQNKWAISTCTGNSCQEPNVPKDFNFPAKKVTVAIWTENIKTKWLTFVGKLFSPIFLLKTLSKKTHPAKICWEFWITSNIGSVNYPKIRFLIVIYFAQVGQRKTSWRGHGGHKVWASWQLAASGVPCVSTIWAGPNRLRSVQLHTETL